MNWDALGAIAELLGASAVVATLVYLAVQIRQTKEIWRTQSYHLAIDQLVAGAMHPDFALLFASEHRDLTAEEREKLTPALAAFIYGHEVLHYLWQEGQVDDALWQNIWLNNAPVLRGPEAISRLERRRGPLSRALLRLLRESAGEEASPASRSPAGRRVGEIARRPRIR